MMAPREVLKVLLIEDTDTDTVVMRDLLEQWTEFTCQLAVAATLEDGMASLQSSPADLVLLDLTLPDCSGVDTVRRLRAFTRRVAIIVVTSIDDTATGIAAMTAGAQDYYLKRNLNPRLLERRVRYAIERQRLQADRLEVNERLRLLAARLVAVREEERTRISREIHDELGQKLTSIKFDLGWMESRLGDAKAQVSFAIRLRELMQQADMTLQTVRRIALELRPSVLDQLGLADAIRDEARRFGLRTGVQSRLEIPDRLSGVEPELCTTCFRILQELLTNVARHARASVIEISLSFEHGELLLKVRDDGVGLECSARTGAAPLGIIGMQERAASHGGSITFDSSLGQGTLAVVRLPSAERSRRMAC